jgi:tetratricopeptide (TPR) repeat protein
VGLARRLVEQFPTLPSCRRLLAHSSHNLAAWLGKHNRVSEATPLYQQASTLLEKLVADFPGVPENRLELAVHYVSLGSVFSVPDPEGALSLADKAINVLAGGIRADPRNPSMRLWRARAYTLRLTSLGKLGRYDEGVRTGERALALDPTCAKDKDLAYALFLVRTMARQQAVPGLWLASGGKLVEAARAADALVEKPLFASVQALAGGGVLTRVNALVVAQEITQRGGAVGETLYNAACVYARCAGAARKEDSGMAEVYAARAVALLARARAEGFFTGSEHRKLLDTDKDLVPLRGRSDFQRLRAGLIRRARK